MDDVRRAEEALVGSLVLAPRRVGEVAGWLHRSDFGSPACGLVYARLVEVYRSGSNPTGTALLDVLREHGELRADGYPISALMQWFDAAPARPQIATYGALVVEGAIGRQVEAAGVRLGQAADRPGAARALVVAVTAQLSVAAAHRRLSALPPVVRTAVRPEEVRTAVRSIPRRRPDREVEHAELVTVGSVLMAPHVAGRVRWLRPGDFTSPDLGRMFATVTVMCDAGLAVDAITVPAELHRAGAEPAAGEWSALARRAEASVPVPAAVSYYGRQILDRSALDRVAAVGERLVELGRSRRGGAAAMVDTAIGELSGLDEVRARLRRSRSVPAGRRAPGLERTAVRGAVRPGVVRSVVGD
jgi:replicative DNA helicase